MHDNHIYQSWLREEQSAAETIGSIPFAYEPLISVVVPTYNTPHDYLMKMIDSVESQTYANWELILVDDASTEEDVRTAIVNCGMKDKRIKYKFLEHNLHIAGATNEAIKIAKGEFISLFDHDDILMPQALHEIVKALNQNRNLDFIYTDEDKINERNEKDQPFFKPGLNEDFLRSVNYITHFTTIRKTILEKYGYEDGDYNGAQDWELFLRIIRHIPKERIQHIPKVLYSWRVHNASTAKSFDTKPYVVKAQENAIRSDLVSRGYNKFFLNRDEKYSGQWKVEFQPINKKRVTIIVTEASIVADVKDAIGCGAQSLDYEVIGMSAGQNLKNLLEKISGDYVMIVDRPLLIKDTKWLENLIGDAERKEIGFVLSWCSTEEVMKNLSSLIGEARTNLVARFSRRQVVKHLYLTTRYNLEVIHSGPVMISREKLLGIVSPRDVGISLIDLSREALNHGYCNLYNPYVKVIK